MRKGSGGGINTGTTPILMIFVLLCLTTFATLSMVSANADLKLTNRTAKSTAAYYTADSAAQDKLMEIDTALLACNEPTKDAYLASCKEALSGIDGVSTELTDGSLTATYQTDIDSDRMLEVKLDIVYPPDAEGNRYKLLAWRPVTVTEWVEDDSLSLWDGNM